MKLFSNSIIIKNSLKNLNNNSLIQFRKLHNKLKECYIENLQDNDKGISIINFDRSTAKNALSRRFVSELGESIDELKQEKNLRVVLLRSLERVEMSSNDVKSFLQNLRFIFREIETLSVPTIAVIDGVALGGGLELALCCDIRVAETKLAIIPGAGGTQRLIRTIGISKAKELIFTGKILNAQDALSYGIVNHIAKQGSSYSIAMSLARDMLSCGPIAIKMAKLAIDNGIQCDLESALDFEHSCYEQLIPTEDRIEGKSIKQRNKFIITGNNRIFMI
ncbi:6450_t:CDS:10 [Entrophospora sp. SA101]|nr:6450_t:CDS:10 [Entrophospora sp. SA101]